MELRVFTEPQQGASYDDLLAGLARETTTIRLGTLMSSATFRLPGPLAITVAQVDQMSGGRVELGIGAGWYEAEHAAYGIPFPDTAERFDRLEETLAVRRDVDELRENDLAGTPAEVVDKLGRYGEAGADRVYLQLLDLDDLEHLDLVADQVMPQL
jgi:alkanesulfonate monooxygenase SsuD/methylene tetrahydromethanopterin reductase-like flavin-dependent oxidoreductase (luciferase family)